MKQRVQKYAITLGASAEEPQVGQLIYQGNWVTGFISALLPDRCAVFTLFSPHAIDLEEISGVLVAEQISQRELKTEMRMAYAVNATFKAFINKEYVRLGGRN